MWSVLGIGSELGPFKLPFSWDFLIVPMLLTKLFLPAIVIMSGYLESTFYFGSCSIINIQAFILKISVSRTFNIQFFFILNYFQIYTFKYFYLILLCVRIISDFLLGCIDLWLDKDDSCSKHLTFTQPAITETLRDQFWFT